MAGSIGLTVHFSSVSLKFFILTLLLHPYVVWALLLPSVILISGGLQLYDQGIKHKILLYRLKVSKEFGCCFVDKCCSKGFYS